MKKFTRIILTILFWILFVFGGACTLFSEVFVQFVGYGEAERLLEKINFPLNSDAILAVGVVCIMIACFIIRYLKLGPFKRNKKD